MISRTLKRLIRIAEYGLGGVGLLGLVLIGRLALGPLPLDLLTPTLTAALSDPDGHWRVEIGTTELAWDSEERSLTVRAERVRLLSASGRAVMALPLLDAELSPRALLGGQVAVTRLALRRPQLTLVRHGDGRVTLVPGPPDEAAEAAEAGAAVTEDPATVEAADTWLERMLALPDPHDPRRSLTALRVVAAELTLDDRQLGGVWRLPRVDLELARDESGIGGHLGARLALGGGAPPVELDATMQYRRLERLIELGGRVSGLVPAGVAPALVPLVPALAPLAGVALPLDASFGLTLDENLAPGVIDLGVSAGRGRLTLPQLATVLPGGESTVTLERAELAGRLEPAQRRLTVERLTLALAQPALTLSGRGRVADGPAGTGNLTLSLTRGPRTVTADVSARRDPASGSVSASLQLANLEPALWADLSPALAPLGAARLPLSGTISGRLDAEGQPLALAFDLAAGAGWLDLPALYPQPLALAGVTLKAAVERPRLPAPDRLALEGLTIDFGGGRLTLAGTVAREGPAGEQLALTGQVRAEGLALDDLPRLWPAAIGTKARDWVVTNMSRGSIDLATLSVVGSAPVTDPTRIAASTLDGRLSVRDATLRYFKELPPVTGIGGEGVTDGRSLVITTRGGTLGSLILAPGTVEISKLDTPQEWIALDVPFSGPLASALAVLDHPPLGYARKFNLDPARTEGSTEGKLHFYFPLIKRLEIDNIEVGAQASLHKVVLPNLRQGLSLGNGELKLALDRNGMDLSGTGAVNGIGSRLEWREAFGDEAKVRTRVKLQANPNGAELARAGLDLGPYLAEGTVGTEAVLTVDRNRNSTIDLALDLGPSRLALPELQWHKAAGVAGKARLELKIADGTNKPIQIPQLRLTAGDLEARGSLTLAPKGAGLESLRLNPLVLGRTNIQLEARGEGRPGNRKPGSGVSVTIRGASFDARPLLNPAPAPKDAAKAGEAEPPQRPLELDLRVARVITGDRAPGDGGRFLTQTQLKAQRGSRGWEQIDLSARLGGTKGADDKGGGGKGSDGQGGSVTLVLEPVPGAQPRFTLRSDDLGALLKAVDASDGVVGGQLSVDGQGGLGERGRPLMGKILVENYRVIEAPVLARLLNALSVTGLIDLLTGEGISFARLTSDFRRHDGSVTIANLATAGGAIGLTMDGTVDLQRQRLALQGTVVPVYSVNRILGLIPLIGDLLSGGEGQGLFAAAYRLTGPLDNPEVSVNPLSMLAPGFLRNLFFLDDEAGGGTKAAP